MTALFLPLAQLGIIEQRLTTALRESDKRKRQRQTRELLHIMQQLGVLPQDKLGPVGCGEGINSLGEKGFWIIYEQKTRVEAQGPAVEATALYPVQPETKENSNVG